MKLPNTKIHTIKKISMIQFDSNIFEHTYIIKILENFILELKTDKLQKEIIDKYACQLTAFMTGQIVQTIKFHKERS